MLAGKTKERKGVADHIRCLRKIKEGGNQEESVEFGIGGESMTWLRAGVRLVFRAMR